MVVESPTKARTISKLFGLPSRRFVGGIPVYETVIMDGNQVFVMDVVASKGHVTDLTLNERGIYGVEVRDRKIVPHYSPLYRCLNCRSSVSKEVEVCPLLWIHTSYIHSHLHKCPEETLPRGR